MTSNLLAAGESTDPLVVGQYLLQRLIAVADTRLVYPVGRALQPNGVDPRCGYITED